MIDPSEITLDVIEEWAKSNDPDETAGQAMTSNYCPVTECLKDVIESDDVVSVGDNWFTVGWEHFDLPADVATLVERIDGTHAPCEPVSFPEVLKLIAEIREEG